MWFLPSPLHQRPCSTLRPHSLFFACLWLWKREGNGLEFDNNLGCTVVLMVSGDARGDYTLLTFHKLEYTQSLLDQLQRHHSTVLGMKDFYAKVMHNSIKETLTELQSRYWIMWGRKFVQMLLIENKQIGSKPFMGPNTIHLYVQESEQPSWPLYLKGAWGLHGEPFSPAVCECSALGTFTQFNAYGLSFVVCNIFLLGVVSYRPKHASSKRYQLKVLANLLNWEVQDKPQ